MSKLINKRKNYSWLLFNHSVELIIIYSDIIIIINATPPPVAIIIISKNSTCSIPNVGIRTISSEIKETKLVITFITFDADINGLLYL